MYSLIIDRKRLNHVKSFNVRRNIATFSDSFNAQFGNVGGGMSRNIYLGDVINFLRDDVDNIFSGRIEERRITSNGSDIIMNISGRDTISDLAESKAPLINFKNTTDNAIIEKVVSSISTNLIFDLGSSASIKEYTIHPGDTIGQVIDGVAKLNNKFIWKRGDTLIKREIALNGGAVKSFYIQENNSNRKNVLNIRTTESIAHAKTKISAFSNKGSRSKSSLKAEKIVDMYSSSAYQTLITSANGHTGSASRFERPSHIAASGKELGEVQRQLDNAVKSSEPKAEIEMTVKNFQNIELNDIIAVIWDTIGVNNKYVVTGLTFELDDNNKETTEIKLQSLGAYPK